MFSQKQKNRIQAENQAMEAFLMHQSGIQVWEGLNDTSGFYRIKYAHVRTSVVDQENQLINADAPVEVRPVSFELIINLPEAYPLAKPEVLVSPAFESEKTCFLFNSHIMQFAICLYSRWSVQKSILDLIIRAWNVVTYNHDILNLDEHDCLNPAALRWYKTSFHNKSVEFPLDRAMEYSGSQHTVNPGGQNSLFKFQNKE